jgi:hypothetical protein
VKRPPALTDKPRFKVMHTEKKYIGHGALNGVCVCSGGVGGLRNK